MRRPAGLATLTVLLAAALPLAPAHACTPAPPWVDTDRDTVVPGGRLRVWDEQSDAPFRCFVPVPPTAEPTAETTPDEVEASAVTQSETPFPVPPSLVPVAAVTTTVTLDLVGVDALGNETGPARHLGTATATSAADPHAQGHRVYRFATTVRLPSDLALGEHRLQVWQPGLLFGYHYLTAVTSLPDTGAPSRDLAVLGLLLVLSGTTAVVAGRRPTG